MRYLFFGLLLIALNTYCIVDIIQQRDKRPHGLPKGFWVIVILLVPYVGAGVWIALKFRGGRAGGPPQPRAPRAPDDDPEYLRWLHEQERRRRKEKGDG